MMKRQTSKKKLPRAKDIDDYLAKIPPAERRVLERLRRTIKSAAPKAVELITYQIPAFKYHGFLLGFAAFKNHCSLFMMNASFLRNHAAEFKNYETTPSAIHFTIEKPLPALLIKKIVKARILENQFKLRAKMKKKDA